MSSEEPVIKCCKTCRWSTPLAKESEHNVSNDRKRLECSWEVHHNLPSCFRVTANAFMYEDEGTHCLCWETKQP